VTPAPVAPSRPVPPARAPTPEASFASLFDEAEAAEAPARDVVPVPRPPAPGTEDLEPLYEVPATRSEPPGEPTTAPGTPAPGQRPPLPASSRRTALAAVSVGAVLVLGVLAYSVARGPTTPPAAPAREAAPPAATDALLAARVDTADRRLSEGRLTGPDGALDHLLAAKALAPDDGRVKERLELLADTLEKLGGRALDRGDVAEAEVHLAAALQASPDRQSLSAKLEALAKLPQPRGERARGERGTGAPQPGR
jgi:hypothetical protein